jgi:hypothetical protein
MAMHAEGRSEVTGRWKELSRGYFRLVDELAQSVGDWLPSGGATGERLRGYREDAHLVEP